jgi:hypothetical protein
MKSNKFVDVLVASSDEPRKSTLWNTLQTGTLLKEVRDGEGLNQDWA